VLFSNLGLAPTSNHFITGAAWTISIEFSFYLVFPFLSRFSREHGLLFLLRLIALVLLVKLAAFAVTEKSTHMLYSTLIGRFDQFLWGMLAALFWHRYQLRIASTSAAKHLSRVLLCLVALAIWFALSWQAREASFFLPQAKQVAWLWWGSVEAILWAAFMVCYVGARLPLPAWLDRWLCLGGTWSYSLYLWHALVIFLVSHYLGVWMPYADPLFNAGVNLLILFPIALSIAALSYYTIEKPFLGLRRAYLDRDDARG
jgi:peptidoglycan/LPS O-acetylase OafA/YrhL